MKRVTLAFVWIIAVFASVGRADLTSDIDGVLQDKLLRKSEAGVMVVRLGGSVGESAVLYRHESEIPRMPASNLKLMTTSAFLDRMGPDFKFRTQLVQHGDDLYLFGDGDPTFGDAELLKKVGWDVTTVFSTWADQLKKRGITAVHNVVVDDSIFDQEFFHPHWNIRELHKRYMAEIAGLNLNANSVDFFVKTTSPGQLVDYTMSPPTRYISVKNSCVTGNQNAIWLSRQAGSNEIILRGETNVSNDLPVSVTVNDPALYTGTVMAETFGAAGIKITGQVLRDLTARAQAVSDASRQNWTILAIHETTIDHVLARANKDSMNLYAECMCKRLGHEATGQSGSWANGTAAVGEFLKKTGASDAEFHLDDGCGLSRENGVSPDAIIKVLTYDFFSKNHDIFISSLAVAGVDGTLDDRFRGTDLKGRVFAKSGFINGVSALSGFLKSKSDNWYAFSILFNNIPEGGKPLHERIVKAVDAFDRSGK